MRAFVHSPLFWGFLLVTSLCLSNCSDDVMAPTPTSGNKPFPGPTDSGPTSDITGPAPTDSSALPQDSFAASIADETMKLAAIARQKIATIEYRKSFKKLITKLTPDRKFPLSPELSSLSEIDDSQNCIQLVKQEVAGKGRLVAEFSNKSCPTDIREVAQARDIRLVLEYEERDRDEGLLKWGDMVVGRLIGVMRVHPAEAANARLQAPEIDRFCDGLGNEAQVRGELIKAFPYQKHLVRCRLEVRNGKLEGITRLVHNIWLAINVRAGLGLKVEYDKSNCVQLVERKEVVEDSDPSFEAGKGKKWIEFTDSACPLNGGISKITSVLNLTHQVLPKRLSPYMKDFPTATRGATGVVFFGGEAIGDYWVQSKKKEDWTNEWQEYRAVSSYSDPELKKRHHSAFLLTRIGNADDMSPESRTSETRDYSHYRVDMKKVKDDLLFAGVSRNTAANVELSKLLIARLGKEKGTSPGETTGLKSKNNCAFWEDRFVGNDLFRPLIAKTEITLYPRPCPKDIVNHFPIGVDPDKADHNRARGFIMGIEGQLGTSAIHTSLVRDPEAAESSESYFLEAKGSDYNLADNLEFFQVGEMGCSILPASKYHGYPPATRVNKECQIKELCTRTENHFRDYHNNCILKPFSAGEGDPVVDETVGRFSGLEIDTDAQRFVK